MYIDHQYAPKNVYTFCPQFLISSQDNSLMKVLFHEEANKEDYKLDLDSLQTVLSQAQTLPHHTQRISGDVTHTLWGCLAEVDCITSVLLQKAKQINSSLSLLQRGYMANRYTNYCLPIVREIQIKNPVSKHLTPVRITIIWEKERVCVCVCNKLGKDVQILDSFYNFWQEYKMIQLLYGISFKN